MYLASSSSQIQTIDIEGLTIETDGRPQKQPRIFDENPYNWLWKPTLAASSAEPSIDYLGIDIKGPPGHIRDVIQKSRLERACAELANLEARN
jgi:hypothetical protein